MNSSTPTVATHIAVQALMQAQDLPPGSLRADGRLTLVVDQRYRVHVSPAADGRVVLNATVAAFDATDSPAQVDRLTERLLQLAQGLLKSRASGLNVSHYGDTLGLQQWLPAQVSVQQLQEAIAHFVNDLSFWVRAAKST